MSEPMPVLKGTLDLLILNTLKVCAEPVHGWSLSKTLNQLSDGVFEVNQGSLYPALHRLEAEGLIAGSWTISDAGRRAKCYALTRRGRREADRRRGSWEDFVESVARVMSTPVGRTSG